MYSIDQVNGALEMDRGDYVDPKLTITDAAGAALNVTGATFKLTVKSSLDDLLAAALFQIATPGGFDVSQANIGIVVPLILETYTQGLAGDYVYDVEMILGGKTTTIVRAALFRVLKDVGDVGSAPGVPGVGVLFLDWAAFPTYIYKKDFFDGKWIKYRHFNRNDEYVSESFNDPPF